MKHEPQMSGTKTCSACGEEKAVICFAVDRKTQDGLHGICRDCNNARITIRRQGKPSRRGISEKRLLAMRMHAEFQSHGIDPRDR